MRINTAEAKHKQAGAELLQATTALEKVLMRSAAAEEAITEATSALAALRSVRSEAESDAICPKGMRGCDPDITAASPLRKPNEGSGRGANAFSERCRLRGATSATP